MKFHWPSFLLGYAAGAATVLMADRLRPLLTEAASAAYKLGDAAWARFAILQEDVEDTLAEARARARKLRVPPARRRPARPAPRLGPAAAKKKARRAASRS
jgi:hypothetical protein